MKKSLTVLTSLFLTLPAFAATPVDLALQPAAFLMQKGFASPETKIQEFRRATDFNQTLHVRVAETYRGYPVWGSDAVVHIPEAGHSKKSLVTIINKNVSMNGTVYKDLGQDIDNTPSYVFTDGQLQAAIKHAVSLHQGKNEIEKPQARLMVFVDKANKAHWAFHVSFLATSDSHSLQKPTFILDAKDFTVYQQWNDIKTLDTVNAGGFGGNHKTGKKIFDGLTGNLGSFIVQRDAAANMCYMQNTNLVLKNSKNDSKVMTFTCSAADPEHNNIYWNGNHDQVATTWSPSNDVMFGAEITRNMFKDWYNMPMLKNADGSSMLLVALVHYNDTNAYWDGDKVIFGDSPRDRKFNPFTQLDTVGHEICHGFTEQHSNLSYYSQSGGLNEAFSDMAGIAAEYYAYGETKFLVGWGDVKAEGKALRYMDQPSKDCNGNTPGNYCSIDNVSQYNERLDVHYSSGIFNRVYYLLATSSGWDARKAFDVMVQANMHYWTSNSSFKDAACGVMKASKDYKYNLSDVALAFTTVGIDTKNCKM